MASPASNENPLPSCQIEQEQRQIKTPPGDRGGYDCEFVERPKELETDCPICLLVLRDPFQTSCCGNSFCQSCIKRVQDDEKACPICNEADFGVFPDKRLRRSLYAFQVRCVHQKNGCEWVGELGELEKHLNLNPELGKQLVGCAFTTVACTHCCEYFQRRHVHAHESEVCPQRPFSCDYCEDYGSVYEDVVNNHWPVCKCYPVPCPNECGVSPERQNVETHVNTVCPLTVVKCDFHYAGCEVQLVCKDMPTHLAESLATHISLLTTQTQTLAGKSGQDSLFPHLSLLALHNQQLTQLTLQQKESLEELKKENEHLKQDMKQQVGELKESLEKSQHKIQELERENEHLKQDMEQQVAELKESLKLKIQEREREKHAQATVNAESKQEIEALKHVVNKGLEREVAELRRHQNDDSLYPYVHALPIEFVVTNFTERKRSNRTWYSLPFYTHPQGYKMCLCVYANGDGDGKGTHVSVYAFLMRGEFDDHLKWPFQGHVVLQLCNQLEDRRHRGHTFSFSETADSKFISRVTNGERAESGWGTPTLIAHNDLNFNPANNCQYLKNDHLRFRIITVESLSEPGVLSTEFTVTNFEQHKTEHDDWYSPPFYTHPRGYKMCLSVNANGDGDGEGTHVSVSAYLMRGEFDDLLKWPFQGRVVLQLCNQLEDRRHRGHTISFSETENLRAISRVTNGERAETGWGTSTLIAHKDLNFNPANNCQYLKHDHLHFRVITVESLSEPGVLPTELTMTNFEQHKIDSDDWHSPPFYTNPQGYKMCLNVYANGYGEGKGTHVSVFACLMRGEFDDHLKWPFQGHVTVAVLNQLEDNSDATKTIPFTKTTDIKIIGRVTDGERAHGYGYDFIAHTDLTYNPAKNCQYLKYDCLRLRIIKV